MDYLSKNSIKYVDYKDTDTLKRFIDSQGRIMNRRQTKLTAKRQREVQNAIKRSRYMGFMPYIAR
jgi:small subunit ribosomal protein S18